MKPQSVFGSNRTGVRRSGLVTVMLGLMLGGAGFSLTGISACNEPSTCAFAEPANFSSVEQLECGISPDGVSYCNWSVSFDNGEFQYRLSDYILVGTYTCDGNTVTASDNGNTSYTGTYDPTTGQLSWDGHLYNQVL